MGAFDPDAYLAKPIAFDPDAYLAKSVAPSGKQYGSEVPSANPVYPDAIPEARSQTPGMTDSLMGLPETAMTLGTGAVRSAVAPYAAVAGEFLGGVNTPEGKAQGARFGSAVDKALTYTPQTQTAQNIVGGIGNAMEGVDLNAIPFAQGAGAAAMAPAALRQGAAIAKTEAGLAKDAYKAIPSVKLAAETKAAANLANSYTNASRIEAAQLANKYGIALDPERSNPTKGASIRGAVVGEHRVSSMMAEQNKPLWTSTAKKDVGIPETEVLDASAFAKAHAAPELTLPYEKVAAIPEVRGNASAVAKIDKLKREALIGEKSDVTENTNSYLDKVKDEVAQGGSGAKLLASSQQLRREAQAIYQRGKSKEGISQLERRTADAQMGIADAIDGVIADNLPTIKDRDAFNAARTGHAKLYQLEEATNLATGEVDPRVFAKMVEDKKPISGPMKDMGLIAAHFPDIVNPSAAPGMTIPRISRGTVGGATGAVIGGSIGGIPGAIAGTAIGGGIGEVIKSRIAKNMLTPEFQAKRAVPTDYRPAPVVNNLRPVTPGSSNIVPFNPVNALMEPEIRPNFVFGRPDQYVEPSMPRGAAQLPAPSGESTMATVAAENARRGRMSRMAGAEEEAAQAAAQAPSKSAAGGVVYTLDPYSGKLKPASQGIKGATPETFQDYTSTLRSAVEKMSGQTSTYTPTNTQRVDTGRFYKTTTDKHVTGEPIYSYRPKEGEPIYSYRPKEGEPIVTKGNRAFDMTAAEKVAWDKTRVDLAEVMPGFRALDQKALAERMLDREWVQDAVKKARQKALAFDDIMKRSKDADAINAARASRERMLDTADAMEENLRHLRPDNSRKSQGPKTRGEIRKNNLAPENRNKLGDE